MSGFVGTGKTTLALGMLRELKGKRRGVYLSTDAPQSRIERLLDRGVEVLRLGKARVDIVRLMEALYEKGVKRLLVEGGGEVRWSFLKERLVDEVFVWIMPAIWGGSSAPTLVEGEGFLTREEAVGLKLGKMEVVDNIIVLNFSVKG